MRMMSSKATEAEANMGSEAHREATHKTCTRCGETKTLDRFKFFSGKRRRSWCVDCTRAYNNSKAAEHRVGEQVAALENAAQGEPARETGQIVRRGDWRQSAASIQDELAYHLKLRAG